MLFPGYEQQMHWYVMRDLKRSNAKLPAYKQLSDEHIEAVSYTHLTLPTILLV